MILEKVGEQMWAREGAKSKESDFNIVGEEAVVNGGTRECNQALSHRPTHPPITHK